MPGFLVSALMGAVLSGISLAIFAPYVTLRRISYMGEALSHIAFAGIAIAIITKTNLTLGALIFVSAVALGISWLAKRHKIQEANTITIFLSLSMALGIILISLSRNYTFDLSSYLFGNVLLVSNAELVALGVLNVLNIVFVLFFYKELFYLSYNAETAKVFKIRISGVDKIFYLLMAANIVFNLKSAGIILVTAQLILPAVIAFNMVQKLHIAIILAVLLAIISALVGFAVSFALNLPTGATIVMCQAILYAISFIFKRSNQ
ncbi:MAG: metal ABC transporter permease [Candidatus Cloacimonetes bacterium]|jgi:zinc transport system permease protein|nr:metal ABC transporter permease [Candidatus Cloacimonadota bacterium]MDY0299683.1 metal ABC transporter permease [Candidatus Cloacimonadaceae bacterium]MCB5279221.1 metal ABC transporter permease [Candidatus Cloacimonadota bacterium]MCK9332329.1 metal ABC transporter permease [Candidatus Cloacimonadota bacterium]MDD2210556.1 metal ABC transporter permease [Candidatus Cloacimonadota bacterium]